jgi:hypothetical protein
MLINAEIIIKIELPGALHLPLRVGYRYPKLDQLQPLYVLLYLFIDTCRCLCETCELSILPQTNTYEHIDGYTYKGEICVALFDAVVEISHLFCEIALPYVADGTFVSGRQVGAHAIE